ncbi:MAG: 3-isopropylmalate dehydratase large subunit [Pyrinomonadaceae bacterium]
MQPRTLFEKIWNAHTVYEKQDEPSLLYIDQHLVHEVTSPQAFEALRAAHRSVRRPDLTVGTVDHNVPTTDRSLPITDRIAAQQIETLRRNCAEFGITFFDISSAEQGIVHVVGPELGLTLPGMTIVCGDSHTSTHGAFGALAFGIGTSEVEHVLATQCLQQSKPRTMEIRVRDSLPEGVTAKDLALGIIGQIGTDGATGHVIEYTGKAIRALSMEQRMTLCNMSIEAGARAGMISPDETTFAYLANRRFAPHGAHWDQAVAHWRTLATDAGAEYDATVDIEASQLTPFVTWGTSPGMVVSVTGRCPIRRTRAPKRIAARWSALNTWRFGRVLPSKKSPLTVFSSARANARLEDLQAAARVINGYRVSASVQPWWCPAQSRQIAAEAEDSTVFSLTPALNGASRAAPCASR